MITTVPHLQPNTASPYSVQYAHSRTSYSGRNIHSPMNQYTKMHPLPRPRPHFPSSPRGALSITTHPACQSQNPVFLLSSRNASPSRSTRHTSVKPRPSTRVSRHALSHRTVAALTQRAQSQSQSQFAVAVAVSAPNPARLQTRTLHARLPIASPAVTPRPVTSRNVENVVARRRARARKSSGACPFSSRRPA